MYETSIEVFKKLVQADSESQIVKISPKGYTLSNGLDFCSIAIKSKEGIDYLLQTYGKEAVKLHEQASTSLKSKW